ncbi:vitamin D3 hydroxylase-associated protein-like [Lingula anatina]|uniref:fatty acid amide hydrolase n=1 Tax=Lingula anatina TaxID=7574 RepID=A0A1S3KAH0_LINAN|nr:vitamin D3 hydroxylase-associated protein-like [Lingula anatina]|eukprot:XP_013419492.1 vitamin D3 hydroxylase-associated protein-like [Lingula anatina]
MQFNELRNKIVDELSTVGHRQVLLAVAGIIGVHFVWAWLKWFGLRVKNAGKRKRKREERQKMIDIVRNSHVQSETYAEAVKYGKHKHHLSEETIDSITNLPTKALLGQLKSGQLLAVDVLHAFQHKALECDKDLNFISTPIVEAEAAAQTCDAAVKKGPLHGLPVSIKESIGVKGYDCTLGCANWIDRPWEEDSVVVKVLKRQGAIPFIKTNVPQTLVSTGVCSNPIYGLTKNPHDVTRATGGSSGGEGSAVAAGASIVGLGTDVGSSIRVPCAFCGVYGLKPSWDRISNKGNHPQMSGNKHLQFCVGPMGRDVDSLVVIMKALLCPDMFELDSYIPPIPFRDEIYEGRRPLRIGYYWNDGGGDAMPAVQRAVQLAKSVLEKRGHLLLPWTPPDVQTKAFEYFHRIALADQLEETLLLSYGDKRDTCIAHHIFLKIPYFIRSVLAVLVKPVDGLMSKFLYASKPFSSMYEWFSYGKEADAWKAEFQTAWQSQGLDAVICPTTSCTALPLGDMADSVGIERFSWLFNLLNYPTGIIPVTKVTADDEEKLKQYKPNSKYEKVVKREQLHFHNLFGLTLRFSDDLKQIVMGLILAIPHDLD